MKEFKHKKKCEYIYNELSETSVKIIKRYIEVLGITNQQAKDIITCNVTATVFLFRESALILYGIEKSTDLLIKATLFRKDGGLYEITEKEKERVLKHYGIEL